MSKKVVAMVPVRAGSVRVKNKNTRAFGDTNLLEIKLATLKALNGVEKIVVTTDCEISAEIADRQNVAVHWRSEKYAGSDVTNDIHWAHIAESTPGEIVLLAQVTSPLLRRASLQSAIDSFVSSEQHDSLNSVSSEKKFLWLGGKPLNYDVSTTPKSQNLPEIVSLNFAISITNRDVMMSRKNVVGKQPKFFELSKFEALDIDDLSDFQIAEALYKNLGIKWILD